MTNAPTQQDAKTERLLTLSGLNNWHIAREGTKVVAYELGTDLFETFAFAVADFLVERGELALIQGEDGWYYIDPTLGD